MFDSPAKKKKEVPNSTVFDRLEVVSNQLDEALAYANEGNDVSSGFMCEAIRLAFRHIERQERQLKFFFEELQKLKDK